MTAKQLADIEVRLAEYSNWHAQAEFSPLAIRPLVEHLKKCHEVMKALSEIAEWEYPFRITPIIDNAIKVLKEVA